MSNIASDYLVNWDKRAIEGTDSLINELQAFANELEVRIAHAY